MIEEVEERRNKISRMAPTPRGEYEQIIIANPDQAILTFACDDPPPNMRMLDRFLIITEEQGIPAVIVANKIDLVGKRRAKHLFGHYRKLDYPLVYTSAKKGRGIGKLRRILRSKLSVFAGPSGAGKSSLLNAIQPELGLQVSEVSQATGKGRHTTAVRAMFPLKDGGYVADTPGLKALALWDIEPEELDGYFPEIAPLVPECQFTDCTHFDEPGCAVIEAVEQGVVHPQRYDSYLRLRFGED
jgi:ribosome biogenesis GTPase